MIPFSSLYIVNTGVICCRSERKSCERKCPWLISDILLGKLRKPRSVCVCVCEGVCVCERGSEDSR